LIEKPQASNSTVIGLSRVSARTEIRFLIRDGEIRTLLRERGCKVVCMEEEPVWVMGSGVPLPTMICVEEELGDREEMLPKPWDM
jgi:hypothetical protein